MCVFLQELPQLSLQQILSHKIIQQSKSKKERTQELCGSAYIHRIKP